MRTDLKVWQAFALASQMGFQIGLGGVIGFFGGRWLDQRFGTEPLFMVIGVLLGVASGVYSSYRAVVFFLKKQNMGEDNQGPDHRRK